MDEALGAMGHTVDADDFELAVSTSHLLHRAQQLAADRFTQLVGETITLRQFAVLAAIAKQPGLTQAELVRATGVDRSTLADMMQRMEKKQWIVRGASNSDGRAYSVQLGHAGRDMLNSARKQAKAADARILDALKPSKRKIFIANLERLSKVLDEEAARAEREAKKAAKEKARAEEKARAKAARQRKRDRKRNRGSKNSKAAIAPKPRRGAKPEPAPTSAQNRREDALKSNG